MEQGTLRLTGTLTNPTPLEVLDGATLVLAGGTANTDIHTSDFATLSGAGTVNGDLANDGTVAIASGALTVAGSITNNGAMTISGGATLALTGTFTNTGLLDLLTSTSALPANFINTGIVLDRGMVKVASTAKNGSNLTVTIYSYSGHTYQLTRADTLADPWNPVGAVQNGAHITNADGSITPTLLTFTDSGATGTQRYYRVSIGP